MIEDVSDYLSVDNGKGILLSKYDAFLLDQYHIDYSSCSSLKDLIFKIEDAMDLDYDEELEMVLSHLEETYYYHEVNK